MPKEKSIWLVNSKTDSVERFIDNGVFLDGRAKALNPSFKLYHGSPKRKKTVVTGSLNVTKFTTSS